MKPKENELKNEGLKARLLPFLAMILLTLTACDGNKTEWRNEDGSVWNTTFHISYRNFEPLTDSIFACFDRIDSSLSVFNDSSIVSRINRNEIVSVDDDFKNVFNLAKEVSGKSWGKFDPTVAPLVDAWGFGRQKGRVSSPSSEQIAELLEYIGIDNCFIDEEGTVLKKSPYTSFNFSAIAKGYACDIIASMFFRNGIDNFLIEIGGEIRVAGKNSRGTDWVVQIDAPIASHDVTHERYGTVNVTDCGIATSGNYRNFYTDENGDTLGHTIDPATGYPVITDLLSATVIAPSTMLADAIATACMALGSEKGEELASMFDDVEVILVTNQ